MQSHPARRGAAYKLVTAGVGLWLAAPAAAQVAPVPSGPAELDPTAPLDPMSDLEVEWPDMGATDPKIEEAAPPTGPAPDGQPIAETPTVLTPGEPALGAVELVADAAKSRSYAWTIEGLEGDGQEAIRETFAKQSALEQRDDEDANAAQIDRRAREDSDLLVELLRSEGYYDAQVTPRIAVAGEAIQVVLEAVPGRRYRFAEVRLVGLDTAGEEAAKLREAYGLKEGDPVVAQKVIDAEIALKVALGEEGFATAEVGERDVLIDHEAATATLTLPVTPGPVARFGAITVIGEPPFPARHVATMARFRTGDRFERSEVDDLRRALIATGLVAAAETRLVPRDDGRTIDIAVELQPAPMRTIAGELGYGTGEGLRAEVSWQHRNFFNPEGALTVRGVAGTQEQLAAVSLRRNNFRARDQVLTAQVAASHVDRKAFGAKTFQLGAGIERQSNFIWHKKWTWSLGAELIASDERDTIEATGEERRRTFFIGALPASLYYDGSDDLLDPTKGFRLGGRVSPELSLQGGQSGYVRTQLDGSAYRPLGSRVVAAGRIRLGSILGAERDTIAPSRRFYSGGGGSVRGYGYQRLGPRDADGDPIGGRSLAEFSLEARVRFGQFGIVPFIDGGILSTRAFPEMKDWQFGVGIGGRYYSSFGPIRIDVGTPLNRQEGDSRIAVTVSLGQAF